MIKKDLTERENALLVIEHKRPQWTPDVDLCYDMVGIGLVNETGPMLQSGKDAFGVPWIATESMRMQPTPDPHFILLDDVENWKSVYHAPDLKALDWEGQAERDNARINREEKLICFRSPNGVFQRLMAFMGFEGMLCALIESPEACWDFFEAVTDYKIETVKLAAKYLKPDIFMVFDDVAHASGLFMRPEMFRELIKPHYKRLYDAVIECGMIPEHHCCGLCEEIVGDFVDVGARIWNPAEPTNNIVEIQKKYGDKLIVAGGFAASGEWLYKPEQKEELLRAEARRCMTTYAPHGSYFFRDSYQDPCVTDEYLKYQTYGL